MLAVLLVVGLLEAFIAVPLAGLIIRLALRLSGEPALSDLAILSFLASPAGAAVGLLMASLVLCLGLMGYAALLVPARAALAGRREMVAGALGLLVPALPRLIRLCLAMVVAALLVSVPFLAAYALIHHYLLGEHDINFYLAEKPPEFTRAVLLASLAGTLQLVALCRLAAGAVHSLPLVLFARETPWAALRRSRSARGQRRALFLALLGWAVLTPFVSALLSAPWGSLAMAVPGWFGDDPRRLALVLGCLLAASSVTGWLVGFCGLAFLALRNMRLFAESPLADGVPQVGHDGSPRAFSWRWIAAGMAIIGAVGVLYCKRWLDSLQDPKTTVVIAHRGAAADAPENTLAAVRLAIMAKADWVEIDVQENGSGTVVVFHDKDFMRVGGPAMPIWEATDSDLEDIDVGSWKSPEFSAERVPRLDQVLAMCKDRAGVIIELKYYGHDQRLEEKVVEAVEAAGMADRIMIMSLEQSAIHKIRSLRPAWKAGLLSSVALGSPTRLDVDFLGLNARTASRKLIRTANKRGIEVFLWTVNDPVDMAAMLGRGADGLITDRPAEACRVRGEFRQATLADRLLLELASYFGRRPPPREQ